MFYLSVKRYNFGPENIIWGLKIGGPPPPGSATEVHRFVFKANPTNKIWWARPPKKKRIEKNRVKNGRKENRKEQERKKNLLIVFRIEYLFYFKYPVGLNTKSFI